MTFSIILRVAKPFLLNQPIEGGNHPFISIFNATNPL